VEIYALISDVVGYEGCLYEPNADLLLDFAITQQMHHLEMTYGIDMRNDSVKRLVDEA
jgi:hypothetical protein